MICSVDMFNEGVDLPHVDTILMLRPTESRILWLQPFGRGLRWLPGKTLRVIETIGNHRVFLSKTRARVRFPTTAALCRTARSSGTATPATRRWTP